MVHGKILISFLALALLLGCRKDKIEVEWSRIPVDVEGHLNEIAFDKNGNGYIVGGMEWHLGTIGTSADAGASWVFDSLTNKRIYDLDITGQQEIYATGVDGYLFSKKVDEPWEFHRLPRWDVNKAVAFRSDGFGFLGGGGAFGNGVLVSYEDYSNRLNELELDFEISDVAFSDDQTLHAVGYGVILRSVDDGANWIWSDVREDFFQAIQFVNEQTGYVVGYTGNILKTTDSGQSWEYLRKSTSAAVKDFPFRDVFFSDEQHGFICGDQGLLWYTTDAGENWTIVEGLPQENFLCVTAFGDNGFLVGEDGILLRFVLP